MAVNSQSGRSSFVFTGSSLHVTKVSIWFLLDDFFRFTEMYPDFAEEYLYPDQTGVESSLETSSLPAPNGFCTDFSPENAEDKRNPQKKKLN